MIIGQYKESVDKLEQINENLRKFNIVIYAQINHIIKEETQKLSKILTFFTSKYQQLNQSNKDTNTFTSVEEINNLIRTVIEEQLKESMNHMSFSQKNQYIFKLFLLIKSIKYGFFDKFWHQGYDPNKQAQKQIFMIKQKCLGMRYNRGKIEQTLKLK